MRAPQRRAHLLEVARKAFLRDGYGATSTLAIANEAGVSETLVLRHFGSKKALFREAIAAPLLDLIRERIDQDPDVAAHMTLKDHVANIRMFLRAWATLVQEQGPVISTLLGNLNDVPEIGAELFGILRGHLDLLAARIDSMRRRPEYREINPFTATYTSIGAVTLAAMVAPDIDVFVDEYVDILMLGILTPKGRRQIG